MCKLESPRPITDILPSRTFTGRILWMAAVCAAAVATLYAAFPLKDLVRRWNDFAFIYAAGRTWLNSGSPYDVPLWKSHWVDIYPSFAGLVPPILHAPTQPYLYPPHWAVIAIPLASVPWAVACRIWDSCNVLAYASTIVLISRLLPMRFGRSRFGALFWLCVAIAAASGALRWALWECQLSIVPTLGVVAAYWAWSQRRFAWMVFFVTVALLKPQIGLLPLAYLALIGGFRGVVTGGFVALGVGAIALVRVDWRLLPDQLRNCLHLHFAISHNALDNFYSVSSLLARQGSVGMLSQLIGFVVIAGLALKLRAASATNTTDMSPMSQLAVVSALNVAFIPLHGYDLVSLTPVIFWASTFRRWWIASAIVTLVVTLPRSHEWGVSLGLHPLAPWLSLGLALICLAAWVQEEVSRSSGSVPRRFEAKA